MSDLIESGDSAEVKEAPADVKGMIQFAQWAVMGVMAILGISLVGMLFGERKTVKKESKSEKDDEDTVADYEKEYLDGDISDEALDEHTVGITA
tara:strand:+ start:951 stop:1232 length:282 start_codon:yes stop_codon:yes gene_type:complete